jgi:myxalamid-type polyketide synthase MxaE and MxaD
MNELSPVKRALVEIERLQKELARFKRSAGEPIAVVGMACRFPGAANSPDLFWRLLEEGRDGVGDVPASRWSNKEFYDPDPDRAGKISSRWGGFLDGVDAFDAAFFGISPREAAAMDPQQRLLLEIAWEAIDDAGMRAERLSGSATGVYVGLCSADYERLHYRDHRLIDVHSGTGTAANVVAGRLSYLLNLQGPAMVVDTACSSSLVALHLACQALRTGEVDAALAAGVNLFLLPERHICASRMRMLSKNGRCQTFDSRADGFVRSEGCATVVLKRLSEALADGDRIHGVIRGSAINQDGRSAGLTAPNGQAQRAVIARALANAGLDPAQVGYVETHGAGTSLGDPIEVEALKAVYGSGVQPCVLGAVKTNIGHTEAAAGLAGFIKAMLVLRHCVIPANLHFKRINPNLSLDGSRLVLANSPRAWSRGEEPRFAAVSSFGWSGTNAHVVLEEAPARAAATWERPQSVLLPVSARSPPALAAVASAYGASLSEEALGDVLHTAAMRRTQHEIRRAAAGRTVAELQTALAAPRSAAFCVRPEPVFVYSGQGGQWRGMGRELYTSEPAFRRLVDACSLRIASEAGWSLVDELHGDEADDWTAIDRIQPALFAVQAGITALLRQWGVQPAAVVGHSVGEVAAAHTAGVVSLDDAIGIVCARSRLLASIGGRGAMAWVEIAADAAERSLAAYAGKVSLAASNGPRSSVVSGDKDAIEALLAEWEGQGVHCRALHVDVAAHSPQVSPLCDPLAEALNKLRPRDIATRMVSTVTGAAVAGADLDASYWSRNLREPVVFDRAIRGLIAEGLRTFVEIGPHPVLTQSVRDLLPETSDGLVLATLRRDEPQRLALLQCAGALYERGVDLAWQEINGKGGSTVALPAYPWQRQSYWVETPAPRSIACRNGIIAGERSSHVRDLTPEAGHMVLGREVMSAAGMMAQALAAAHEALDPVAWELRDVAFKALLACDREAQLVLREQEDGAEFGIYSRNGERSWLSHVCGRLRRSVERNNPAPLDLLAIRARCGRTFDATAFYGRLARQGVDYGTGFRLVVEAHIGDGEALVRLRGGHLDACLQGLCWAADGDLDELRVPVKVARVALHGRLDGEIWAFARWRDGFGDVVVADPDGRVLAEINGIALARLAAPEREWLWQVTWQAGLPQQAGRMSGRWNVVGPQASEVADRLRLLGANARAIDEDSARWFETGLAGLVFLSSGSDFWELLAAVQALADEIRRDAAQIVVVTFGTQAVGDTHPSGQSAELWGLAQIVRHEFPRARCRSIDLSALPDGKELDALADELAGDSAESHVALRGEHRWVARIGRAATPLDRVANISEAATYLIVGGTGGLGLATAGRLVEKGARHLALAARGAPSADAEQTIRALDAHVRVFRTDVGDRSQVARLVAEIDATMPPLRGIVHAAGVIEDALLAQVRPGRAEEVLRAKREGAWHLHELTLDASLDFFVMFSSASSVLGAPGQAAYAAANASLDGLAHYRRRLGLPALSINWGRWTSLGAAADALRAERLTRDGFGPMAPAKALDVLDALVASDLSQVAVMSIDFRQWSERFPHVAALPFFEGVREQRQVISRTVDFASLSRAQREAALEALVWESVRAVLRLPDTSVVGRDVSLFSCGLDSMTALELRGRLENALDLTLSAVMIWRHPTVADLSASLLAAIEPAAGAAVSDEADFARLLVAAGLDPVTEALPG